MFKILRENPKAFLLALAVHALLIVALSFSVDWHSERKLAGPEVKVIQAVMIDESKIRAEEQRKEKIEQEKQRKLEDEKRQKLEQEKQRKEEEARKQREAEKRKQAELKKKQAAEKQRKAEAERKRKQEEERKAEALRKKQEAELEQKRKAEEAERKRKAEEAERKRQAEEAERKRKAEEERKRKEEEAHRRAEEEKLRQAQMAAEQAAIEAARQQAVARESDKYILLIKKRVEDKWRKPASWPIGTKCTVKVRLVPGAGGTAQVIDARVVKSCGSPLFDRSVETAVFSASPLPFPTAMELRDKFRELDLIFNPEE